MFLYVTLITCCLKISNFRLLTSHSSLASVWDSHFPKPSVSHIETQHLVNTCWMNEFQNVEKSIDSSSQSRRNFKYHWELMESFSKHQ